jgi:hypothetical protein
MKKRAILHLSAASTYVKSANTLLGGMIRCMSTSRINGTPTSLFKNCVGVVFLDPKTI